MRSTINADNIAPEDMKERAMIFIRKHMEEALKVEYLAEEDPRSLWVALEERFNHQRTIYLPEARHDWQNIRFQDFKTVNEYNSEICRIRSLLKFCGEELTEADLLEKTFSTFPPSCMVLQQQYRERNFARFSELVTIMLLAEKNNDLLLRNDQARPTGTRAVPLPEANAIAHRENNRARRNRGRGRGRRPKHPRHGRRNGPRNGPYDRDYQDNRPRGNNRARRNRGRGRGRRPEHPRHGRRNGPRNGPYDRDHQDNRPRGRGGRGQGPRGGNRNAQVQQAQIRENVGPARHPQNQHNLCYRCGGTDYWSRTCRATNEEIGEYHARRGTREANLVEWSVPIDTTLEITDFQAANGYIED
ncbi:uncharacterized protein LOC133716083 [Rosa rugosa]|uniref:uncharacterized protein LOC133716083 n=1 Tax=Rosa rugosa TaxID=74645 RepID=UPI002B40A483|nr:uncharacterized protein LOC133716083 [Rosa rugosa]